MNNKKWDLIGQQAAADHLGKSRQTIATWIQSKKLKYGTHYVQDEKGYAFSTQALDSWREIHPLKRKVKA